MKKTILSALFLAVIAAVVSCLSYSPGYSDANGFGRGELSFMDARKAVKAAQSHALSEAPDGCVAVVVDNTAPEEMAWESDTAPGLSVVYRAIKFRVRVEYPDQSLEIKEFVLYFTDGYGVWHSSEAAAVEEALARQQKRPRI